MVQVFTRLVLFMLAVMSVSTLMVHSAKAENNYTWYFVRHAEKMPVKDDPELSPRGKQRAQLLAVLLSDGAIEAIYSTPFRRTEQTAAALSSQSGVAIEFYSAAAPEQLIANLRKRQQTSLIVGHSNTIPELVRLAGGTAYDLTEEDYGDIFVVELRQGVVIGSHQQQVELP